jgi:DNA-directed RNA polymerase subunit beta
VGRVKTYEAIIKGQNIPSAGIPESFKVLIKELQSLGLDVRVLKDDNTEVEIMDTAEYGDTSIRAVLDEDERFRRQEEDFGYYGHGKQEFQGEELVDVDEEAGLSDEEDAFPDFFGDEERQFCTTDTTHPNDYGFHKMARVIEPVLKNILENK